MKVLLDTDITSYIFWHRDPAVRRRFLTHAVGDVGISAITAAELHYGAAVKTSEARGVERALLSLVVAPFDASAAQVYGEIRTILRRRGTPIGPLDMLIAAHAIALDIPLATNNLREFRSVPGLRVENWLA
ncbi:MAG: PIN domain-containing protein [Proteobacteria bacterium]|nr:PIN domain-containing protein [Pseudomonadota bacterium]